ncbi:MAG: PDZ domain-containing protein [Vulcanimicrobiaceae bacterium]
MTARWIRLISAILALALFSLPASAQLGPATAAGLNADAAAAARRVMMHALQSGGNHGGCHPLPAGWSMLLATVRFPSSYGGYGEWINNAELLPVSDNLSRFLKSHSGGPFYQPAEGTGARVHTALCAPAGYTYWLVVDSGMAKVAIGRVTILRPGRTYRVTLTAPPLHTSQTALPRTAAPAATTPVPSWDTPYAEARLRSWLVPVPSMGIAAWSVTPEFLQLVHAHAASYSIHGIVIAEIDPNGRAASAGLRRFDIVTAVNGRSCATVAQFADLVSRFASALQFSLLRNKHHLSLSAPAGNTWQPPTIGPGFVPPATPKPGLPAD